VLQIDTVFHALLLSADENEGRVGPWLRWIDAERGSAELSFVQIELNYSGGVTRYQSPLS
jgi:hypothetical protein